MIFDTLCDIAERWFPEIVPMLQQAVVIRFDVVPHQVLPTQVALDDMITLRDEFTLPAPNVVIEDKASCVLLFDPEPGVRGLFQDRIFLDCVPVVADSEAYAEIDASGIMDDLAEIAPPGSCIVSLGYFKIVGGTVGSWKTQSIVHKVFVGSREIPLVGPLEGDEIDKEDADVNRQTTHAATKNAVSALEELIEIQKPGWQMHRECGVSFRSTDLIPRSDARDVFTPARV